MGLMGWDPALAERVASAKMVFHVTARMTGKVVMSCRLAIVGGVVGVVWRLIAWCLIAGCGVAMGRGGIMEPRLGHLEFGMSSGRHG